MEPSAPNYDLFLARRAAAGQADAWDELIERYGGRIHAIARQFARTTQEAEDLTQEIFLRLYQNLSRYRGDVPLVGWALRLSRNLCIDRYRKKRREGQTVSFTEEIRSNIEAEMAKTGKQRANGWQQTPFERAVLREQVRSVYEALEDLQETDAALLLLHDLQGLTYQEVATFFTLPVGTVKSRLHRARRKLRAGIESRLEARKTPSQKRRTQRGPSAS